MLFRSIREQEFPKLGYITLKDNETGEILTINSSSKDFRKKFLEINMNNDKMFKDFARKNILQIVDIKTDDFYIDPLIKFFRKRAMR